jgi:ABC-type transport system substrate-binding protein
MGLLPLLGLVGSLAAQQPRYGGPLRGAWEAEITGLDPVISPGLQSWHMMGNLFNSLITIDTHLNYVPDLAESWELAEDGKVYVFHLRKGVKFHDGTDFDAEAVKWNHQRIMDPEEKAFVAPMFSIIDTLEAVDAYTVKFTLKHPSVSLLPVFAVERVGFVQMSPASYQRWGKEEVRLHPAGTGPFKLAQWEQTTLSSGFPTWIASNFASGRRG